MYGSSVSSTSRKKHQEESASIHAERNPLSDLVDRLTLIRNAAITSIKELDQIKLVADTTQPPDTELDDANTITEWPGQVKPTVNATQLLDAGSDDASSNVHERPLSPVESERSQSNYGPGPANRNSVRDEWGREQRSDKHEASSDDESEPSEDEKERMQLIAVLANTISGITNIPQEQIFPDTAQHKLYNTDSKITASGLQLSILSPIANASLNDVMAFIHRDGSATYKHMTLWSILKKPGLGNQLAKTIAYQIIANNTQYGKHWYRSEQRKEAASRFAHSCTFWKMNP